MPKKLLKISEYYEKNTSKKNGSKKGKKDEDKGSKSKGKEGSKSKGKEGSKKGKEGSKSKGTGKVYCGPKKEIPKSYDRAGTMLECAQKRGGISLWGVNKVDSKILKLVNGENDDNKKIEDLIKEIKLKQAGLQGKLTKLRKEHASAKDDKTKENIKKEFDKIKNEINKLQETVDSLKK
jgi:hypothetical protein